MLIRRKGENSGIEFLIMYKKTDPENQLTDIDRARKEWMKWCNSHQAGELVKNLYTKDAYYYNRGRLLKGTESITEEYAYMNSPSYSLTLTPKHVELVNSEIAFEIGKCSGSYPNPYMLLWKRQDDGNWKILMDSNY
jgi:ketosteroid isomerase-like protein